MAKKRILLVDDSNTVLLMHRMMLKHAGYELILAHDGEEAVELALQHKPDLILMDVVMPVMNGVEACRVLRAREETKAVPILMVSTRGEPVNVQAGYEAGCTEYVTKPFESLELMARLRTHLGE